MDSSNTIEEFVSYLVGAISYMYDLEKPEVKPVDKLRSALYASRRLAEVAAALSEKAEDYVERSIS